MSEHPPSRPETRESSNEGHGERKASPASVDPVETPPRTAEEAARLNKVRENLSSAAATTEKPAEKGGHAAHGGHGHENPLVKWGVKQPFAIFGYLFSLAWQGLKRWGEMAGKGGGGGHAKASGGDHGGGHH